LNMTERQRQGFPAAFADCQDAAVPGQDLPAT
jgi:hypothetical protein